MVEFFSMLADLVDVSVAVLDGDHRLAQKEDDARVVLSLPHRQARQAHVR
jgi:hypothetical protein